MTIDYLLTSATQRIASLDAEVLLAHVLTLTQTQLITRDTLPIDDVSVTRFDALVSRRAAGEPLAYIVGEKAFFGLTFAVDPRVLIPRPETEILVEEVLRFVKWRAKNPPPFGHPLLLKGEDSSFSKEPVPNSIREGGFAEGEDGGFSLIDVGTGSGCIPIAIKKYASEMSVSACDISPDALAVARENAQRNDVAIDFFTSDLINAAPRAYDIVTANLPYVGDDDAALADDVHAFEPHLALFGGADGLDLYRRLLSEIQKWRTSPAFLVFECAPWQTDSLAHLTRDAFSTHAIEIIHDLSGQPRHVRATRTVN